MPTTAASTADGVIAFMNAAFGLRFVADFFFFGAAFLGAAFLAFLADFLAFLAAGLRGDLVLVVVMVGSSGLVVWLTVSSDIAKSSDVVGLALIADKQNNRIDWKYNSYIEEFGKIISSIISIACYHSFGKSGTMQACAPAE